MCNSRLPVQSASKTDGLRDIITRKLTLTVAAVLIVVMFCKYFHLLVFYDSFNDAVIKSAYTV
jgi:hypothetical protein